MKVTVCFDNVRVIVPCGDGSLLVRDLIDKAIIRYKKATAKPNNAWVHVHYLKVSSDGGILDPDDQLIDVADDREQILADFDEQGRASIPHNGGDGTSASSTGTASPDMYHHKDFPNYSSSSLPSNKLYGGDYKRPIGAEVVVTKKDLATASPLKVRRGSEPSLVHIGTSDTEPEPPLNHSLPRKPPPNPGQPSPKHHWTTLTVVTDPSNEHGNQHSNQRSNGGRDAAYSDDEDDASLLDSARDGGGGNHSNAPFSHHRHPGGSFSRDSARKSLGTGGMSSSMYRWLDAQERAEERGGLSLDRQEPLGGTGLSCYHSSDASCDTPRDQRLHVSMANEPGPLGIHVVPNYDEDGRNTSLMIQGIEPGGRIERDGRLRAGDSIVEINGTSLMNKDFNCAQEIFKDALMSPSIELAILRPDSDSAPSDINQSQPSTPLIPPRAPIVTSSAAATNQQTPSKMQAPPTIQTPGKVAPPTLPKPQRPTPEKGAPGAPGALSPPRPSDLSLEKKKDEPSLERGQFNSSTNTKRIGNKININLIKGAEGLGFSITTRDNPAGGPSPIYIKNILPKGAAIKDGRLKSGDRLLQVSGVDVSKKTQSDTVQLLRTVPQGGTVELLVSRQGVQEQFPRPMKPRTSPETTEDEMPNPRNREILDLDIPLNETGSAGLGVSVKGKMLTHYGQPNDLGIFVKSVIHGGAAQKDSRLRVNDQLLEVNSIPLAGKTNAESMDTLRKALINDGPRPGYINLVVSRKIGAPTPTPDGGTFSFTSLGYDNRELSDSLNSDSMLDLTNESFGRRSLDAESTNQRPPERFATNQREDERVVRRESSNGQMKARPHSTIGFSHMNELTVVKDERLSTSLEHDDTDNPFSREAPGRQSMSEKRKGHMDPKQLDLYQKIKNEKKDPEAKSPPGPEEIPPPGPLKRVGSAESLLRSNLSVNDPTYHKPPEQEEVGPMLGLKKSSSLESLQRAVLEMETQVISDDDEGGFWPQSARSRGTNESFRAAVDRSYENQAETGTMEMLEEDAGDDMTSQSMTSRSRLSVADSTRSSISEKPSLPDRSLPSDSLHSNNLHSNDLHGNNLNKPSNKDPKSATKKNIFKGFFKFGQRRKQVDTPRVPSARQTRLQQEQELARARTEFEAYRAKKTAEIEQNKIREQYEKLKQQELNNAAAPQQQQQQQPLNNDPNRFHGNVGQPSLSVDELPSPNNEEAMLPGMLPSNRESLSNQVAKVGTGEMGNRADRIQQLRQEHQRKHQARKGRYPLEEQEEWAERELQRLELKDRRYGNSSQDYVSLPDWLDSPDPLYSQIRPHDRSLNTLYSDSNLVLRTRDIQGGNLSHFGPGQGGGSGQVSSHMSPRGPYSSNVNNQEIAGTRRGSQQLQQSHKSVFDSPRNSPRLRAGSFDQSRSRSETRGDHNATRDAAGNPRFRSKTPNFSNSTGSGGMKKVDNRLSLAMPSEQQQHSLLLEPLDFDDPKMAYQYQPPQYAVVHRRPHKV